jgi:hypothetical protein
VEVVGIHDGFKVNVKGKQRLIAKMKYNEENKQGLKLYDTIRASVNLDDE